MTDYIYNRLADLMVGMKGTFTCMNQSREESCNRGKYTLSLGAF